MWISRDQDTLPGGFYIDFDFLVQFDWSIHVSIGRFRTDAALPRARFGI